MHNDDDSRRNRGIPFTSELKTMLSLLAERFSSLELSYRLNVDKTTITNWLRGQARILSKNAANIEALYIQVMQNTASEAKTPDSEDPAGFERENVNPEPEQTNSQLVVLENGQLFTNSDILENRTGIQRKNVLELIRKYEADLNEFGRLRFKTLTFETAGGMQTRQVAILNEQQATLVMTYFRNTDIVRDFKIKLVKTFFHMREQLRVQNDLQQLKEQLKLQKNRADFQEERAEFYKETSKAKSKPKQTYTPNGHQFRTIKWLLAQKPFLIKDQKQRTAFYTFLFGLNVITRDGVGCKEWRLHPDYAYMGKLTVTAKTVGYANRYIEISPENVGVMNDFIKQFIDRQPGFDYE